MLRFSVLPLTTVAALTPERHDVRLVDENVEPLDPNAEADLVAQSSVGFETQGMTVYESIAVGTPVFVADPKIAAELPPENVWLSKSPSVDDMARALTRAAKDIRAGNSKRAIDTGDWSVLQSEITEKMIAIYKKAIAEGPKS